TKCPRSRRTYRRRPRTSSAVATATAPARPAPINQPSGDARRAARWFAAATPASAPGGGGGAASVVAAADGTADGVGLAEAAGEGGAAPARTSASVVPTLRSVTKFVTALPSAPYTPHFGS